MLVSEIMGWHYIITWDNPIPANSSGMMKSLRNLGTVTKLATKTAIALSPKSKTDWREVMGAITDNLDTKKGNAIMVNIRTGKTFQYGSKTKRKWKSVN